MKPTFVILLMAASVLAANAQTAPAPASPAKPVTAATATAKPATKAPAPAKTVTSAAANSATPATAAKKLPFGVPAPGVPSVKTLHKTAFSLTYQEIKVGTGPEAEPGKMYKVLYTGYRAADGVSFDSSDMHRMPLRDKDGKPVLGDDGKPKLDVAQPLSFPQGMRRLIPGFDQGFGGMKVGGKRRLFIPWQLAYGTQAMPDHGPEHPGIPAKSDLIFDIELVSVEEMPAAPARPGMGGMPGHGMPMPPNHPGSPMPPAHPAAPGSPAPAATPNAAPAVSTPAAAPAPAVPAPAAAPATPVAPAANNPAAAPASK